MSEMLARAIRRQKAIREARDFAWIIFIVMLAVGYVGVAGVRRSLDEAGTALTFGGVLGVLVGLVAVWIALNLLREAVRLGKLLRDPESIMSSESAGDLVSGVRWSSLNPFARKRS